MLIDKGCDLLQKMESLSVPDMIKVTMEVQMTVGNHDFTAAPNLLEQSDLAPVVFKEILTIVLDHIIQVYGNLSN